MEENRNYTYTYQKKENKQKNTIGIIIAVFALVAFIGAAAIGSSIGRKKAKKEISATESQTVTQPAEESTTAASVSYRTGPYSVNTGGYTLLFRKEPRKDSEAYLEIPDKKDIEVIEVYYDESAEDENYRYWGKIDYLGYTGWVAMNYLKKEYSDSVVTPEDDTTTTESVSNARISQDEYEPGVYMVSTDGSTLRFKEEPSAVANVIASLPDGLIVTVTEIIEVESDDEVYRYWGKLDYEGHTGYVSMRYLEKQ